MRLTIVLMATMALTLLVASGVALAVTKIGTNGPDTLKGTNGADNLLGNGGNDVLYAFGGKDNLLGGEGKDWVLGGNERRALGGVKNLEGGPGNDGVSGGHALPSTGRVLRHGPQPRALYASSSVVLSIQRDLSCNSTIMGFL
jgi:hypothetical protein